MDFGLNAPNESEIKEKEEKIIEYTQSLSYQSASVYLLHIWSNTKENPLIKKIKERLLKIDSYTQYHQIKTLLDSFDYLTKIRNFGKHDANYMAKIETRAKRDDYSSTAFDLFSEFLFEDSLKFYRNSVHLNPEKGKFYKERSEIYLLQKNFKKALSLSKKGRFYDMLFASSIADGNIKMIQEFYETFLRTTSKNQFNFMNSCISRYEFEVSLVILSFAIHTSRDVKIKTDTVFQNSSSDHSNLKEIAALFSKREFPLFLEKLSDLEKILKFSFYGSQGCDQIIEAIKENVIVNEVLPFKSTRLVDLQTQFGFPLDMIKKAILNAIGSKKLNGKLDLKENVFLGGISDLREREISQMFNRSVESMQNIQLALWIKKYNSENTLKKKELAERDEKLFQESEPKAEIEEAIKPSETADKNDEGENKDEDSDKDENYHQSDYDEYDE